MNIRNSSGDTPVSDCSKDREGRPSCSNNVVIETDTDSSGQQLSDLVAAPKTTLHGSQRETSTLTMMSRNRVPIAVFGKVKNPVSEGSRIFESSSEDFASF